MVLGFRAHVALCAHLGLLIGLRLTNRFLFCFINPCLIPKVERMPGLLVQKVMAAAQPQARPMSQDSVKSVLLPYQAQARPGFIQHCERCNCITTSADQAQTLKHILEPMTASRHAQDKPKPSNTCWNLRLQHDKPRPSPMYNTLIVPNILYNNANVMDSEGQAHAKLKLRRSYDSSKKKFAMIAAARHGLNANGT